MKLEEILPKKDYPEKVIDKVALLGKDVIPEIENAVSKYDGVLAKSVAFGLLNTAYFKNDRDIAIETSHAVNSYSGVVGGLVLDNITRFANFMQDKNTIINFAKIMSLNKIVNFLNMYQGNASDTIVGNTAKLAKNMASYNFEGSKLEYNLDDPTLQAFNLKSFVDIMSDQIVVNTIKNSKEADTKEVARELVKIASNTRQKNAVIAGCKIINNVGLNVFDFLSSRDFMTIADEGLDRLIENTDSFDSVLSYIKSNGELPKLTKYNLANYQNLANDYLSSAYGINKRLNLNQILMLFSVDDYNREEIAKLVNNSVEKDLKIYSLVIDKDPKLEIDKEKLPYLSLIAVTGSRDSEREKEAFNSLSKIVGEKTVRRAEHSFNSNYKAKLIGEISQYVKKGDINQAINLLKDTKDESINDVLSAISYNGREFIVNGKNTILSVQSNNPLDYDSRLQIACVYLPADYNGGIETYCKDKRFNLIRYDINGKSLGSAICYHENQTFLVDSVEGHRIFRKPQVFGVVYQDLIDRAREKGAKQIIFNTNARNETPKGFTDYIQKINPNKGKIKMKLDTRGYLEAKDFGLSGYIVNL